VKAAFLRFGFVFAAALIIASAGCAAPRANSKLNIAVHWSPNEQAKKQSAVWLGYLLARANYIGDHKDSYAGVNGISAPQFQEEVEARSKAALIYEDLSSKDKELRDTYFEDLLKVERAGFMKEYVWTYLRQPTWPETEKPSNLVAFNSWNEVNLPNHQPVTY